MRAIGPVWSVTPLSQSVFAYAVRVESLVCYLFHCRNKHDGENQKRESFGREVSCEHDGHRLWSRDDGLGHCRDCVSSYDDERIAEKGSIPTFCQMKTDDRLPFRLYKTSKKCQVSFSTWKKSQVLK